MSSSPTTPPAGPGAGGPTFWVTLAALTAATGWAYSTTVLAAAERWSNDPQYSHGYLVPLFSLYLLYRRRSLLAGETLAPSWWALAPAAVAVGLRMAEAVFFYNGLDALSLVPAFLAVLLASGGVPALKWGWPAAAFLVFMVPLPFRLQTMLSNNLQSIATQMCTVLLVTIGYPAVAKGNIIVVDQVEVGVVDACSGLGMVMTFAALSVGFALVTRSALWVKVVLLLGALPIAVVANVLRICATAMLYQIYDDAETRTAIHDGAGYVMIPLGCVLVLAELWVLDRVLLPAEAAPPRVVPPGVGGKPGPAAGGPLGLPRPGSSGRRR